MPINARTRFISLLGYPLGHSLSPEIHNTALQHQQINMVYLCMEVHPDNLRKAIDGFRAARFVGSNVTIPHKQAVFDIVDELSDQARAVGAVNTIVSRFDSAGEVVSLYGDNTDIRGFLDPMAAYAEVLKHAPMVVFGAGGAARAVIYALLTEYAPESLTIVARNAAKADQLARDLRDYDARGGLAVSAFEDAASAVQNSRLVVNATPLGMHGNPTATPWGHARDLGPHQLVYDLIYNPQKTKFMVDAGRRGAKTLGGLDMLIRQAAASYRQWTDVEMPLDIVEKAVLKVLDSKLKK